MSKVLAALLILAGAASCADDDAQRCDRDPDVVDPDGVHHGWVVQQLNLPDNPDEAVVLGLEIYEYPYDETVVPDNSLGILIGVIADYSGYELDRETAAMIDAGQILHLLDVQATSLENATGVGVTIRHGIDLDGDPSDNFSGETFGVDPSRGEGFMSGTITDGHLEVHLGTAPIAVTFPGLDEPFVLQLIGAKIDAWFTPEGELVGRLGGAIREEHIVSELIPVFHEGLSRIVARDCVDGVCAPDSLGRVLLDLFDSDEDGTLSLAELSSGSALTWLMPDVDLRNARLSENSATAGDYAPGCGDRDDVNDAVSVGLGFRAVPAEL